ncbi:MAG: TonB-dependent receptor, partial [Hymenobacteraceae bacterium]|nr:TonB-dependent receptor [Hymenobacteraceae bacterium]MDX5394813.1 TonB-dependent receptor [Hymenobacteraceae bacterium]MDX5510847.1 TonB-dependent receptor [Hymenobacteraceae bacterium]
MNSINIFRQLILLLLFAALTAAPALAQVQGHIFDKANLDYRLVGATVVWKGTSTGTSTDATGYYSLPAPPTPVSEIVISYIGYKTDTINVAGKSHVRVLLQSSTELKAVEVVTEESRINALTPTQTQVITSRDLEKSACCNLAESFETNASVEVTTTDAVSGAKQIQMLGLDGSYTLLTTDNIPALRGLATPYRLNYLSGTYISAIDIIKGTGSVINGYEAISGQINVRLQEPDKTERLYLNLYGNSLAKFDANLNLATSLNKKWSTVLMLHSDHLGNRVDRNDDGFMDLPLSTQYNVYNKWKYSSGKNFNSEFAIGALRESRVGGQMGYEKGEEQVAGNNYGTESVTDRFTFYNKNFYTFTGRPYQSLAFMWSGTHHNFDSHYGPTRYDGTQNTLQGRLLFSSIIGTTAHTYKVGLSFTAEDFKEKLNDTLLAREERVPGAFAEYTYQNSKNITAVAGARIDQHNLYGTIFTPRANLKYDVSQNTILRAGIGRGFRVANPISETSQALVSARNFVFEKGLNPLEKAWNMGGSFTQYFELAGRPGAFIADYYYTTFQEQVITDMVTDADKVLVYNLDGKSFSNSFQAELNYEMLKGLDVKAAYKYYDVQTTFKEGLQPRLMIPQHRFFVNLGFATPFDKWRVDLTTQWYGVMPLAMQE